MSRTITKQYVKQILELVDDYTPSEIIKITNIPRATVYRLLSKENFDMCDLCNLRLSKGKCESCRDKRERKHLTYSFKTDEALTKAREQCVEHFSNGTNDCKCCGENNIKFLTLSHKNNDGAKHRREGNASYRRLVKDNFETDYEIIIECYNCNLARSRNGGKCPHEDP